MPEKCPGSASVATRMPFGSVVIWSSSTGSFSSATAVASPLLPLHRADLVSDEEACESPRDNGCTVRGLNISRLRGWGDNRALPTKFRNDEAGHVLNRCGGNSTIGQLVEPHRRPAARLVDMA
jgi:hypothetical protein